MNQKEEIDIPLTTKYRPMDFKSLQGQELPKIILHRIAKDPTGFTRSLILSGSFGCGKSLVNDTNVLTPTGSVKIGNIMVGQPIIGSDGDTYQVTGVFPQGKLPVVEIVFEEDTGLETLIKCSLDHLWQVRQITAKMILPQNKVVNTQYLLDNFTLYDFILDYPDYYQGNRFKQIQSIKLTDYEEEMTCISVSSPDELFIVDNHTLTHNTSSARIFAKALNCESKTGDACNECQSCIDIHQGSNLYQEFDSSVVGNVEKMKEIKDILSYSVTNGYKVIVFDECHLISKQAMSSLLKVLEEASPNIYYLFPTTDPDKMMDTIKSRSLLLTYQELTDDEMKEHIRHVSSQEGHELPSDIEEYIVRRVKGHVRDSIQQLQLFFKLGYEDYKKQCVLLDKEFFNVMKYAQTNKIPEARETIKNILRHPVPYIRQDFEEVIKKIANSIYISHQENKNILTDRKLYQRVIQYYFENNKNIIDTNHWFIFLSSLISVIREPEFFNFNS